jgi:hypothetical protein
MRTFIVLISQAIHRCSIGFPSVPRLLFPSKVYPALSHGPPRIAEDNHPDRAELSDRWAAFADPPLLPVVFSLFLLGEIRDRLSSFLILLGILSSIGFHSKNQRICISSRFV